MLMVIYWAIAGVLMGRGENLTRSLFVLAIMSVMSGIGSARAADLGGDCCADLEERVADLEATTARKGNRKVSLKISDWVNRSDRRHGHMKWLNWPQLSMG